MRVSYFVPVVWDVEVGSVRLQLSPWNDCVRDPTADFYTANVFVGPFSKEPGGTCRVRLFTANHVPIENTSSSLIVESTPVRALFACVLDTLARPYWSNTQPSPTSFRRHCSRLRFWTRCSLIGLFVPLPVFRCLVPSTIFRAEFLILVWPGFAFLPAPRSAPEDRNVNTTVSSAPVERCHLSM